MSDENSSREGDDSSQQGNGDGNSSQQGNDGGSSSQSGDSSQSNGTGENRSPGTAEKVMMTVSVLFTVALLAYAGWQVVAAPATAPAPQVQVVETETLSNGSVAVTVELRNPTNRGLVVATVESQCSSPPPSVQFSYVPADSTRKGTLVCPTGTESPSVSVTNWIEA